MANQTLNLIKDLVIEHNSFGEALKVLEKCYKRKVQGYKEHIGVSILGEAGLGKTTLVKKFRSRHISEYTDTQTYKPIVLVTVPPKPTGTSLCTAILDGLGDGLKSLRESERIKRSRVVHLLKACETKVMVLDEVQHFTNKWNSKVSFEAADSLKIIIDETNIMIVVVGLNYGNSLLIQNEQLKRRFTHNISLSRFDWNQEESRRQFRGLLKAIQSLISPFKTVELSDPEIAFKFFIASGGITGYLMSIIEEAALLADEDCRDEISMNDFSEAFNLISHNFENPKMDFNPFNHTQHKHQMEILYQQSLVIGVSENNQIMSKDNIKKSLKS